MNIREKTALLLEDNRSDDRASQLVDLGLILLILLNIVAIVLESVESVYKQYQTEFIIFDVFSVVVFTIEYLARVWSCVDSTQSDHKSPVIGRLRYMLTPLALVDLIAIAPFYLSLYLPFDLRFLRVLRMLRLFKLTRYSRALRALLDVLRKESDTLVAAMLVLFIMLIISASGIYLLEHKLQPEAFSNIPDAMWWAIATLTTVGYGDIVPITPLGKLFGGIIGLIGVGMVALPAAILASGFAENLQKRRQRFSSQVKHMLADGEIDEEERWQLERLRRELRLDSEEAIQLLDTFMRRPKSFPVESCPHCGKKLERRKKPRETAL